MGFLYFLRFFFIKGKQESNNNSNNNQNNNSEIYQNRRNSQDFQQAFNPPPLKKVFQYDFLSNRVFIKNQPEKPSTTLSGNALKNLYNDNNPVIYNHNLQINLNNYGIVSKKKIYAGLENDYSEIPKR